MIAPLKQLKTINLNPPSLHSQKRTNKSKLSFLFEKVINQSVISDKQNEANIFSSKALYGGQRIHGGQGDHISDTASRATYLGINK